MKIQKAGKTKKNPEKDGFVEIKQEETGENEKYTFL